MVPKSRNLKKRSSFKGIALMILGVLMFIFGLIFQLSDINVKVLILMYLIAFLLISQGNKIRKGLKKELFEIPKIWGS